MENIIQRSTNLVSLEKANIEVYDIEVFAGLFLYCGYRISEKRWVEFEISQHRNDIDALVKHLLDSGIDYAVSFNGLGYDSQVLQYIQDKHHLWADTPTMEIVRLIRKFSDKVIDDSKYDLYPPYKEEDLYAKQIDLFRVHHFDNKNKRCSLKWLEFSMDAPSVEETPFEWTKQSFTLSEIEEVKKYCRADIENTYRFWRYTIGDTDHPEYRGRNMIQQRMDLIQEFEFPLGALSWSDVKMGDEINKTVYMKQTGIGDRRILKEMKLKAPRTKPFTYADCIPSYVEFRTPEFKRFFERMRKERVMINEKNSKKKYPFTYNGTTYVIAKGGIHSNEKNRIVEVADDEFCEEADIGSQYPHSMIKRQLFPLHLGKPWLVGFTQSRDRRLEYKALSKTSPDPKYDGLAYMFKFALNGGGFGMTNQKDNWQYYPFAHFSCTIGNQFEILMLIEWLEVAGIHVISANTDGIVVLAKKSQKEQYRQICHEWEKRVGNDVHGRLEFTEYKKLVQLSVNGYLAIKADGKVKKKKEFLTEPLLEKNKSRRIVALALENYFVHGIPPEQTILNHKNIFDFCIGVKSNRDYHYEAISKDGTIKKYYSVVRYYVSQRGDKLLKIKNPGSEADGPDSLECEAGGWLCTVANTINEGDHIKAYKINYDYYIQLANQRIGDLEAGRKRKKIVVDKNQLTLF
jgi:hypothetical protein